MKTKDGLEYQPGMTLYGVEYNYDYGILQIYEWKDTEYCNKNPAYVTSPNKSGLRSGGLDPKILYGDVDNVIYRVVSVMEAEIKDKQSELEKFKQSVPIHWPHATSYRKV